MPLYSWKCHSCDTEKDVFASIAERNVQIMCECGMRMRRILTLAQVMPDITPYRAVAGDRAGKMISSRREHREFLKRNRFTEVGNEPVRPIKNSFKPKKGEVAQELKSVLQPYLR